MAGALAWREGVGQLGREGMDGFFVCHGGRKAKGRRIVLIFAQFGFGEVWEGLGGTKA